MRPVTIMFDVYVDDPKTVEARALEKAAEHFDVPEDEIEVTYLSEGRRVMTPWEFSVSATWNPPETVKP